MATKVVLPRSGMGIEESTVSRWLKTEGDAVTEGEPIAELETAKAVEELAAPVSGKLVQIVLREGQTAPVGTEIAIIEEGRA